MKFVLTFITICCAGIAGMEVGIASGINRMQKAAIEAKVAEWKIDAKTGERSFEYKKF